MPDVHRDRRKVADVLSAAGINERRVAIEILYLLPPDFVRQYEDLFHRALTLGDEGSGSRSDRQAELGRSVGKAGKTTEWGGSGASGGGGSRTHSRSIFPVKSEEALMEKDWVDRQLRKLARQIKSGVGGSTTRLRCGSGRKDAGCGKWLEEGWSFCPGCGLEVVGGERARARTRANRRAVKKS